MDEQTPPLPPAGSDPGHAPEEAEETRLAAWIEDEQDEQDEQDGPPDSVTIIDRGDRLEAEHRRLPVHGDEDGET